MNVEGVVGFGYMQARVQAGYAQLADNALWSKLGAIDEYSAYLEECRTTSLSSLVAGISTQSNSHNIDLAFRHVFLHYVVELSSWVPKPWQPVILWLQWLPEIPLISYLLNEQYPIGWTYDNKCLSIMSVGQDMNVSQALHKAGAGCLISKGTSVAIMLNMWQHQWPILWPNHSHHFTLGIKELIEILQNNYIRFKGLSRQEAWKARDELRKTLRLFFRRHLLQPATALVYIALMSLQLERLRAELLHRLLYPDKRLML